MNLDFDNFCQIAQSCNVIPVFDELPADLDTPVSAFLKIRQGKNDFLLESVVGGEKWARYSFLGTAPRKIFRLLNGCFQIIDETGEAETVTFKKNPLEVLRDEFADYRVHADPRLPRFFGGVVGYLSYDMVRYFDNILLENPRDNQVPDLLFLLTGTVVIFDTLKQVMQVVHTVILSEDERANAAGLRKSYDEALKRIVAVKERLHAPMPEIPESQASILPVRERESVPKAVHEDMVLRAKEYIAAGDAFQVVLSRRTVLERNDRDAFATYRSLRRINPSPYLYFFDFDDLSIVGASPEVLVRVEDGMVAVRPIAGTRKRGDSAESDRALEADLRADPKELAEHIMLVDLGRNDVGRVAVLGSVKVDELEVVERYSHVMHLVSHVSGKLSPDHDVFDVIAATFPAGTLSGAPKIRAMEIIEELESHARGVYGGAVGYVSFTGNMDLAIAIRTAVFKEEEIIVQAGGGIVYHSDPASEFEECVNKAKAVMMAIEKS
jgi:anthranilate synthase component 1